MVAAAQPGSHSTSRQYRFSYTTFNKRLFRLLGVGPKHSWVEVDSKAIRIRSGWSFSMTIPRASIRSATRSTKPFGFGAGVHGWRGRWVVNGSNEGIVRLVFTEPQSARTMIFPIKPRELFLSLEDPAGFLASLGTVG